MLHNYTHKRLWQCAAACLGNGFNSFCHVSFLLHYSRWHLCHVYADNCHQLPPSITSILCHHLFTSTTGGYLLSPQNVCWSSGRRHTVFFPLASCLVKSGIPTSQLPVLLQLQLLFHRLKETILEGKTSQQTIAGTTATNHQHNVGVFDRGYKILWCMRRTNPVTVLMEDT